jgi:hypothetical protein
MSSNNETLFSLSDEAFNALSFDQLKSLAILARQAQASKQNASQNDNNNTNNNNDDKNKNTSAIESNISIKKKKQKPKKAFTMDKVRKKYCR